MTASHVIDATDATFEADVIEASRRRPVVVDFWAPWCQPCLILSPTLERLTAEQGVTLVKVNIDENPGIARAFKVESIPAVKAFKDGRVASEFVGAQPEPQVAQFLAGIAPNEADRLAEAGAAALKAGDLAAARRSLEGALTLDARHPRATGAMAATLIEEGDLDGAEALVARMPGEPMVKRQAARIRFERGAQGTDEAEVVARVEADPNDVAARYALGCHFARRGQLAEALEHFLEVVMIDRKFQDDGGRQAILQIFELLGDQHPVTREYRPRLASLLF
jgi:putative thioredoxin